VSKLKRKYKVFLALALSAIVVLALGFLDKGLFFSFVKSQSMSVSSYKYGTFEVLVYEPIQGSLARENVTGVMLAINNECSQRVTVTGLFNSTYSVQNPPYLILVWAPAPNGSIVQAFEETRNIYLGYVTILIPTPRLWPGIYVVALSDGMDFTINVG
jgi:hypothetical protein